LQIQLHHIPLTTASQQTRHASKATFKEGFSSKLM
jgi:hypothetical protein